MMHSNTYKKKKLNSRTPFAKMPVVHEINFARPPPAPAESTGGVVSGRSSTTHSSGPLESDSAQPVGEEVHSQPVDHSLNAIDPFPSQQQSAHFYNVELARLASKLARIEKEKSDQDHALALKDVELAQKDTELAKKDTELAKKDTELAKKDTELAKKETELAVKDVQIALRRCQCCVS
jgi:hypothetical protein